jgi:hypothetical protein
MLGPPAGPDHLTISHQLRLHIVITCDSRVMISTSPHDVKIGTVEVIFLTEQFRKYKNENKFYLINVSLLHQLRNCIHATKALW